MAYSFKQRPDGGYDFFRDNQKTNIEDYVKNTGANQNNLRAMMAQRGDPMSQQIMKQNQPIKTPTNKNGIIEALGSVNDFMKASNEKFLGGTIKETVNLANWLGSGFNQDEAKKRTDDFLKKTGQINAQGYAPLTAGANRDSQAFKAGETAGQVQKTAFDVATMALPGIGAEKALRATKALQTMSNAGKAGKLGTFLLANTAGSLPSSAINVAQTIGRGEDVNIPKSMAESLALDLAIPAALKGVSKIPGVKQIGNKIAGATDNLISSVIPKHIDLAKNLDSLPKGSPERASVIQQMIDSKKAQAIAQAPQILDNRPKYSVDKINPNEAYTLSDYGEMLNPNSNFLKDTTKPGNINAINQLYMQARNAAKSAGVDIISGTRKEIQDRIIDFTEQYDNYRNPVSGGANVRQLTPEQVKAQQIREQQAGFAKLPGGDKTKVTVNPNNTREVQTAVNNIIYKKYPELAQPITDSRFPNGIPRIKPSSIKEVTGLSAIESGIPPRYLSEANGVPLDKVAVDMQYKSDGGELTLTGDDVLDAIKSELSNKKIVREVPSNLAELRRNPKIISEAKDILNKEKSYYGAIDEGYIPTEKDYADLRKLLQSESRKPNIVKTISKKAAATTPQTRGFIQSVQNAPIVDKAVKKSVEGLYTPKTNDTLMGEAKALLTEGGTIDFKTIKNADQKVAATMQEAINQQAIGNYEVAANLFNNLSEQGTELGRGVQAFSLLKNMSPESVSLSVAGKIKKFNQMNPTKKIPELNAEQMKIIADKITAADLLTGRDKNIALNELGNTISDFIPSTLVDKALTVWKAGLLTSLRTQARNFVGNTIHGIAEVAKDVPASFADRLLSLKTGKRTLTATTKGLEQFGSKSTRQQIADIVSKGYDPSETINKFDYKKITWGNNPVEQGLKKYTDIVFRTLGASDKPFYNSALARSLYDQAGAAAINAGKKGDKAFIENLIKNPPEDMMKIAISDANISTFKNKNVATNIVNQLKQGLDKTEAGKLLGGITMPFTGVPTSILGQMVAYSPIGLVKGIYKTGKVAIGQVPELQRQAVQELGRGVIGTGIFGLGSYLASQGLITGQPKDAEEARQWELENKPRNSIMIGGKWRSLNSIGPEAVVFLAGTKLNEEQNKKDGSIANYALTLGKDYLDQSFVQGLQSPINALTDPKRYAKSYAGNTVSSVIPNIVKDIGKAFDPTMREANTVLDYAKSNVPGLRNTMLLKRDALGNPLPQEPTGIAAMIDLFNSKTPNGSPVVSELNRLYNAEQSATPSKLTAKTSALGIDINMTPEQLDQFEQKTGTNIQQQMQDVISTPEYQQSSDEMKKKTLESITDSIRKSGKIDIVSGNTTGNIDISKISAQNKLAMNKDLFDKSGENFLEKDGYIYTRNDDGTPKAQTVDSFAYDLGEAQLAQYKEDDDVDNWVSTAKSQIDNIKRQLKNKAINPIEETRLNTKLKSLESNVAKYTEYGGFTKGKSGSSKVKELLASEKSIYNASSDTYKKLLSLLGGTIIKPTTKKVALKEIKGA